MVSGFPDIDTDIDFKLLIGLKQGIVIVIIAQVIQVDLFAWIKLLDGGNPFCVLGLCGILYKGETFNFSQVFRESVAKKYG